MGFSLQCTLQGKLQYSEGAHENQISFTFSGIGKATVLKTKTENKKKLI
jgi:hypothetical protein